MVTFKRGESCCTSLIDHLVSNNPGMLYYHLVPYSTTILADWLNSLILDITSCPNAHDNYIMRRNEISFHELFFMKRSPGAIIWFISNPMSN